MTCAHLACDRVVYARRVCWHHHQHLYHGRPVRQIRSSRAARVEDALWLLSWGTPVEEVARRVGYASVAALESALRHTGHYVPAVAAEVKRTRTAAA